MHTLKLTTITTETKTKFLSFLRYPNFKNTIASNLTGKWQNGNSPPLPKTRLENYNTPSLWQSLTAWYLTAAYPRLGTYLGRGTEKIQPIGWTWIASLVMLQLWINSIDLFPVSLFVWEKYSKLKRNGKEKSRQRHGRFPITELHKVSVYDRSIVEPECFCRLVKLSHFSLKFPQDSNKGWTWFCFRIISI